MVKNKNFNQKSASKFSSEIKIETFFRKIENFRKSRNFRQKSKRFFFEKSNTFAKNRNLRQKSNILDYWQNLELQII